MPASGNGFKPERVLRLSARDNVLVALGDLRMGETIALGDSSYVLATDVHAKHKFATEPVGPGSDVLMYGVLVGKAVEPIAKGAAITPRNTHHQAAPFHEKTEEYRWTPPDVSRWQTKTFQGYHGADGQVGTRNYWSGGVQTKAELLAQNDFIPWKRGVSL
jgi:altronate hydrolase